MEASSKSGSPSPRSGGSKPSDPQDAYPELPDYPTSASPGRLPVHVPEENPISDFRAGTSSNLPAISSGAASVPLQEPTTVNATPPGSRGNTPDGNQLVATNTEMQLQTMETTQYWQYQQQSPKKK